MTDYKPITGTLAKPGPALPEHGRICRRCGIEYSTTTENPHCVDCRLVTRTPKRYRGLKSTTQTT